MSIEGMNDREDSDEVASLKEGLAVLREQLAVATQRAQAWRVLANNWHDLIMRSKPFCEAYKPEIAVFEGRRRELTDGGLTL